MAFSFSKFVAEVEALAPAILDDIKADIASVQAGQSVAQVAAQAVVQASQEAQQIDPSDTDKITAATSVAEAVISASPALLPKV